MMPKAILELEMPESCNGMYEELLEKLRKNNRMSGWTHIDRLIDMAAEAIEALQQENEQLRAQVARVREALEEIKDNLHAINCVREMPDKVEMYANEAISIIDEIGGR